QHHDHRAMTSAGRDLRQHLVNRNHACARQNREARPLWLAAFRGRLWYTRPHPQPPAAEPRRQADTAKTSTITVSARIDLKPRCAARPRATCPPGTSSFGKAGEQPRLWLATTPRHDLDCPE